MVLFYVHNILTVPTRGNKKPAPTLARTSRMGRTNPAKIGLFVYKTHIDDTTKIRSKSQNC